MNRFLLVDDESIHLNGMCKLIEHFYPDCTVNTADNGQAALSMMQAQPYDIVITDIRMHIMDGLTMILKWREAGHSENEAPVFIILSVYSEFDYARKALRLGVVDYLLKPTDPEELQQKINQILGISEADNTPQNRELIETCVEYLKANYMKEIRQEQCAQMIHFSNSYFSILFKNMVGVNFRKYVQKLRVENARTLLQTTEMKVYEVARSVGFTDVQYFNRVFKSTYNVTPDNYRRVQCLHGIRDGLPGQNDA